MNEFTIVTVIARPVDEVFAVLTDLERMPLWVPGMAEASVTGDGPLEAGSAFSYRGAFLGRGLEMPPGGQADQRARDQPAGELLAETAAREPPAAAPAEAGVAGEGTVIAAPRRNL